MHYNGVTYISFGYNEDYNIPIMEFIIIKSFYQVTATTAPPTPQSSESSVKKCGFII
jgi:hypothetical protein